MLDYFGKNASDLREKRLWLLDMDGTIYQEEQIFEGTLDFLRAITDSGGEYVFITNNSSKSVVDYLNKVHRMGIRAEFLYLCAGNDSLSSEKLSRGKSVLRRNQKSHSGTAECRN